MYVLWWSAEFWHFRWKVGVTMDTAVKETDALTKEETKDTSALTKVTIGCGKGYLVLKRLLDIVVSFLAIVVLLFPMIIVGIMIRLDSEGPALFKQKRMGRGGKVFVIYKFRTMKQSAPQNVASRDLENPEQHLTKLGSFLRRTSIDELPQLFNIVKGDMSFIGYRPVCLTETKLNTLRKEIGVFALRPGITGLAQVSGRDNVTSYRKKAQLDAQYVSSCSLQTDIRCMVRTVRIVISGEGAN